MWYNGAGLVVCLPAREGRKVCTWAEVERLGWGQEIDGRFAWATVLITPSGATATVARGRVSERCADGG